MADDWLALRRTLFDPTLDARQVLAVADALFDVQQRLAEREARATRALRRRER